MLSYPRTQWLGLAISFALLVVVADMQARRPLLLCLSTVLPAAVVLVARGVQVGQQLARIPAGRA